MVERLAIILFVVIIAAIGIGLVRRRGKQRAQNAIQRLGITPGILTVVYFWSPRCHLCRNAQKPILQRIAEEYGEKYLRLISYNVDESSDIAKAWGVMSIPTTFVIDQSGEVLFVNIGLATDGVLHRQLELQHISQGKVQ
jgi:thiol-disulfide isomerase/thioredoxin